MQPLDPPTVTLMHFSTFMWALAVALATAALSALVLHAWRVAQGPGTEPDDGPGVWAVLPRAAAAVTFDERGLVESINPAGEALFGVAEGWVGWVHIGELLPQIDAKGLAAPGARAVQTVGRHVSGALVPVEVALTRMEIAGREHHCAVVRDEAARESAGSPALAKV